MSAGWQERVRGAFWGLACGDALGAPAEFMEPEEVRRRFGRLDRLVGGGAFGWAPGEWTDDTALALAAAAGYEGADFDLDRAGAAMVAWYRSGPKDIGNTTRDALHLLSSGRAGPREAGARAQRGGSSAGNGSLMRAAPTGLARVPGDDRLVRESIEISAVTHADPRCLGACVAFNAVVSELVEGGSETDLAGAFARARDLAANVSADVAAVVDALLAGRAPLHAASSIGFVLLTLERGLRALRDACCVEEGVVDVVHMGGDTDTNAAVAGALLGARFGYGELPEAWITGLARPDSVSSAAEVLVRVRAAAAGISGP